MGQMWHFTVLFCLLLNEFIQKLKQTICNFIYTFKPNLRLLRWYFAVVYDVKDLVLIVLSSLCKRQRWLVGRAHVTTQLISLGIVFCFDGQRFMKPFLASIAAQSRRLAVNENFSRPAWRRLHRRRSTTLRSTSNTIKRADSLLLDSTVRPACKH